MKPSPVSSLLLLLLLFRACLSQGPITCSAGTFVVGSTGSVTCYFNQNINATQNNFNVVWYSKANGDSETYVVLCNWTLSRQLECKVETGFSFNHKVTDTLAMDIVDITQAAEGLYVCQVVPDNGIAVKTCNLSVHNADQQGSASLVAGISVLIIVLIVIVFVLIRRALISTSERRIKQGRHSEPETTPVRCNLNPVLIVPGSGLLGLFATARN